MLTRDDIAHMASASGYDMENDCTTQEISTFEIFYGIATAAYAACQAAERQRILSICKEVATDWGNYSGGADECIRRIEEAK